MSSLDSPARVRPRRLLVQRAQDLGAGEWHFAETNADGVVDRVGDGGHPWMTGIFAKPLAPEWPGRPFVGDDDRFDDARIEIEGGRRLQIEERRIEATAGALVETQLLGLRQRKPLDGSPFDLVLDDGDIDRTADIVGRDVLEDVDLAGFAIDFDFDEVRAGCALDVDAVLDSGRGAIAGDGP